MTFSESVSGFTSTDVVPGNAAVNNFAGSGADYSFDLVAAGQGLVTANIAGDVAQDAAGNGNTAATQFSRMYDSAAPTVSVTSIASDPTNQSPIPVTVTFSEAVLEFDDSDLVLTNGTAGNFAGSGADYTFSLTPGDQGLVTVELPADAAVDAAGNGSTASTPFSRTYDTVSPTLSIASTASNPTSISPIPVTVTLSEDVLGFEAGDVALENAVLSNFSGFGANYTFELEPLNQGLVTATVPAGVAQDDSGNDNLAAAAFTCTYDSVSPTIHISPPSVSHTHTGPVTYAVQYGGADLITLSATDVQLVTTGTVQALVTVFETGSNTRDIIVDAITGAGTLDIVIPAGTAFDFAGNAAPGASPNSLVTVDVALPLGVGPLALAMALAGWVTGILLSRSRTRSSPAASGASKATR